MSQKRTPPPHRAPSPGDPRFSLAVCAALGILLFGLAAYLSLTQYDKQHILIPAMGGVYLVIAVAVTIRYLIRFRRLREAEAAAEQVGSDIYRLFRTRTDIPYAIVNAEGTVRILNNALQEILGQRSAVCHEPLKKICPGITQDMLEAACLADEEEASVLSAIPAPMRHTEATGGTPLIVRLDNGRRYRLEPYRLPRHPDPYYCVLFRDVNDYLDLLDETDRAHVVVAYIMLDNLQELTQFVRANYRATANLIEETLTTWIHGMHGMLREYDRDKYIALFSSEQLDACIRDDFPILSEIMGIRVGDNSFPLSVSMGIADIDGSMKERDETANMALEMALQRGGNQVALQRRGVSGMSYFGGAHKTLESNTAISSRVSAHLLEKQLAEAEQVFIMPHANPDFDAIGSAVGAYRLCRSMLDRQGRTATEVHIVTNLTCDTYEICRKHLEPLPFYDHVFIDKAAAVQTITPHTVLIITDVNNPAIFEAPELLGSFTAGPGVVSPIAVIDHHRLVSELPFTPFLHYIEATKSSASEIIAEILQQSDYADTLHKEEANLLLAGIMLDTHNFTRAAGAQTFEVTYYLYSRNAHTGVAREFFNERMDELQVAGEFDANARIYEKIFAITWLSADHPPAPTDRIAASKAADKLLSIRGIEASFAFAVVGGSVSISARSKGRVNVQLIMEKLEGGGHFDMAGAQVRGGIDEAYGLLTAAIDEYRMQFPDGTRKAE